MADTGYLFATSSVVSTGTWTTTQSMFNTDGVEATCTISTKFTSSVARLLNFGFTTSVLPDTATVSQVFLRAVWRVTSAGGIAILGVAVHHSTSGLLSTEKNTAEVTTLTTDTYNITNHTSWTPAQFRDGTLEVHVRPNNGNNATNPFYRFDSVSLDVIYTVPAEQARQFFRSIQNLDGIGSDGFVPGNQVE